MTIRIRRVFGESKGVAGATPPSLAPRSDWLRGLDLNQRPLGYEGNPDHHALQRQPANPLEYLA